VKDQMGVKKDLFQSFVTITKTLLNDINTLAVVREHFGLLEQMIQRLCHALNRDGKTSRQVIIGTTANSKTPIATMILVETVERLHIKSVVHCMTYKSAVP
jgi:hypothetical protein